MENIKNTSRSTGDKEQVISMFPSAICGFLNARCLEPTDEAAHTTVVLAILLHFSLFWFR